MPRISVVTSPLTWFRRCGNLLPGFQGEVSCLVRVCVPVLPQWRHGSGFWRHNAGNRVMEIPGSSELDVEY